MLQFSVQPFHPSVRGEFFFSSHLSEFEPEFSVVWDRPEATPVTLKHSWPWAHTSIMTSVCVLCSSDKMPQTPFCTCHHVPAQIMTCTEKKKRFHRADECIQPARHSTQQCTAQSNSFMFMVPLWPKYFIFVVVAINQIIKSKTGFIGASKTKAWLLYKVDFSACGCKMQAKQDYSTAVLHMVSWLQECTVQRLFRIECNTTFWEKKMD